MRGRNIQTAQSNREHRYQTPMAIFGNQLKAARALAGLDQKTLADRSGIGVNTLRNMEAAGAGDVPGLARTLDKIVRALKAAGVTLVDEDAGGRGVRLRKAQ
jgi:transcriptional regulator with XRE-family HTH domain